MISTGRPAICRPRFSTPRLNPSRISFPSAAVGPLKVVTKPIFGDYAGLDMSSPGQSPTVGVVRRDVLWLGTLGKVDLFGQTLCVWAALSRARRAHDPYCEVGGRGRDRLM